MTDPDAALVPALADRFSVLIDLESSRDIETSAGGVSWRMGPPCESGECAEAIAATARSVRYYPLHPRLFQSVTFPRDWLDPSFAAALAQGSDEALLSILHVEVPKLVFSFEMVTSCFCTLLLEELAHYEASGLPVRRPNTMNRYGLVINQIGLRPLLDDLQQSCLLPLSRLLFPAEGASFDDHHSFMVKYRNGEDVHLDMHHDDAEVTLNVCLGKAFTGATLSFCGGVGEAGHRKHMHKYTHRLGRAVVHKGSHRHGADELEDGERISLIMWSRSSSYRQSAKYLTSHIGWRRTHPGVAPPRGHGGRRPASATPAGWAEVEVGAPDPICLSETHDADYGEHAPFRAGVTYRPLERAAHLGAFSSDDASARAVALKARGTVDFKAANWAAAAAKYAAAAEYIVRSTAAAKEEDGAVERAAATRLDTEEGEMAAAVADEGPVCCRRAVVSEIEADRAKAAMLALATLWLNEAQCQLNLQEHEAASQCCSKVLALEADGHLTAAQCAKAYFRRGLASMGSANFEGARTDLLAAGQLEPANKAVRVQLRTCAEQSRASIEHEKELYRRALGGHCGGGGAKRAEQASPSCASSSSSLGLDGTAPRKDLDGTTREEEKTFDVFDFCEATSGELEVVD